MFRVKPEEFNSWQQPILSILTSPPASPSRGNRHLVGSSATGAWAGHDNAVTWFDGVNWQFDIPSEGWIVYNKDDNKEYLYDGTIWGPKVNVDESVKADATDPSAGYLSNKVDNSTLEVNTTNHTMRVKASGITSNEIANNAVGSDQISDSSISAQKLNTNVAGNGLELDAVTNAINVKVDDSTIEINSDTLRIKDGSISDSHLANTYIRADGTVAFTGDQSLGSNRITNLGAPVNANDAVRKADLDAAITGLTWKAPVEEYISTPPTTPNNGDRYLVASDPTGAWVGYTNYIATWNGSWVFEGPSDNWAVLVKFDDSGWTYDADTAQWIQFSGAGQINAGDGLTKDGNTLDILVDNTTLEINADAVRVKDGGISANKLGADVTGDGLTKDVTTSALKVQTDGSTITVSSSGIKVTDASIGANQLVDDGVTAAKINSDVAGSGLVQNVTTGALDINPDNLTIEIVANQVQVKDASITAAKISNIAGAALAHNGSTNLLDVQVDSSTVEIVSNKLQLNATLKSQYDLAYTRRAQYDSELQAIFFDI